MQVTKNITLDLLETGSPVIIKAKQNDRNTRYIAAHLYVGRLDYQVPSGTEIAFRYKKPDGTAGFYDALPNNSPAITVSGNTVTVELVEQVLTVSGCVHCEINMYNAASEKLTTFTFEIAVEESVLTDAEIISSDYYNVLTAEITKALQAVTDATEQAENAAQSAQEAADSASMSKDWAAGQPVTYSGAPVSIAYAGAQRIASITAYGETPQGGTTEAPVALTGISSVTVNDDVTELPIPRPLRRVGDVRDVCVTRQEYEGTEKLVVTYNVGFVELDGTEDVVFDTYGNTQKRIRFDLDRNAIARYALNFSHGNPGDTPTVTGGISASFNRDVLNRLQIICSPDTWTALGVTDTATAKTWLAAQKAAGTPVQVAYQLATPEVYATDPLDIDNAAGPLTVMTGGEVEVRMTELVGTRSDVSNNTVAFTETAQDADISSGEKLTVLFGKIKKRFAVIASNLSNIYNKTESDERYATAAQGEKADNALPKTGGTISGNLTVVQDLTVQRAFNGMRIKAGVKIITTPTTSARAELFNSDTLNTLFGTTGVSYTNGNCVVLAANGDYDFHPRVVTSGYVNSKWAVFTADAGNFTISTMRVNYIAIKFA
nr:MAG TPA: Baseplate component [Caudoviricetes sp.]